MPTPCLLATCERQNLNLCAEVLSSHEWVTGTPRMGCSGEEVNSLDGVQVHGRWSLSLLLRNSTQKQRQQQDSICLREKEYKGENAGA